MEYRHGKPVTEDERKHRDKDTREHSRKKEEESRKDKAQAGGQTNQLGVTQGQNGEQGNTTEPQNTQPIGRPGEE